MFARPLIHPVGFPRQFRIGHSTALSSTRRLPSDGVAFQLMCRDPVAIREVWYLRMPYFVATGCAEHCRVSLTVADIPNKSADARHVRWHLFNAEARAMSRARCASFVPFASPGPFRSSFACGAAQLVLPSSSLATSLHRRAAMTLYGIARLGPWSRRDAFSAFSVDNIPCTFALAFSCTAPRLVLHYRQTGSQPGSGTSTSPSAAP